MHAAPTLSEIRANSNSLNHRNHKDNFETLNLLNLRLFYATKPSTNNEGTTKKKIIDPVTILLEKIRQESDDGFSFVCPRSKSS